MVRGPSGTKCGLTGFNAVSYCRRNVDIDNDFETGCTDCNSLCSYKTARPSSGLSSKFTHTAPWLTTDHSDQARSTNALYRWCSGWKVKNVVNISQNARCMLARCKVNHWLCILHFAILHNAHCTRCQKQTTSAMLECCPVLDLATVALTLTHTFRHLHMCTLHISHLHTCTLHISHWNGYCSLHIAHCTLHIAYQTLPTCWTPNIHTIDATHMQRAESYEIWPDV